MCLLYGDYLEAAQILPRIEDGSVDHLFRATATSMDHTAVNRIALKRAAPTPLEQERTKVPKLSEQKSSTGETDEDPIIVDEQLSCPENLSDLRKDLASSNKNLVNLEDANKELKRLCKKLQGERAELESEGEEFEERCQKLEDERDMWQLKFAELQEKVEAGRVKVPGGKGRGNGKSASEKLDQEIKQKWEKRIKDQKDTHEEKYEKLKTDYQRKSDEIKKNHEKNKTKLRQILDEKNEKQKQTIEELKEKHTAQEKALTKKTTKQVEDMKEKLDDAIADHKETQQALKEKHKTELNRYRPEHSDLLKKKDDDVIGYLKKIADMEESLEQSKQETQAVEKALAEMTSEKDSFKTKLRDEQNQHQHATHLLATRTDEFYNCMRENSKIRTESHTQLKNKEEEWSTRFNNRVTEDEKKWQIQYEKAENNGKDLATHRRAVVHFRDSLNGKLERIQQQDQCIRNLRQSLQAAMARISRLTAGTAAASTSAGALDDKVIEGGPETIQDNVGAGDMWQGPVAS